MYTLRQDGLLKCQQGMTTLDQVLEKTVIQKESLPHYLLNPDEMIFENGDIIIKEGNTDTSFYKLIQGCLEVFKGNNLIAEISQSNTYFGEMSALVGSRRSATIKSKGRSIVKVFPGDKLGEVLENYPDISKQIIDTLVLRLNESSNRLSEMMQNRIELERTYVNQLTSTVGSAGAGAAGGRPIAPISRGGGPPLAIATSAKPSASAKLPPRKPVAGGLSVAGRGNGSGAQILPISKPQPQASIGSGGNGASSQQPVIRPIPSAPAYAQTALVPPAPAKPIIQAASKALPADAPAVEVAAAESVEAREPRPAPAGDLASRKAGIARSLLPADQTQLVVVRGGGPAAKILREVRQ
jgi:CRP-like cAMP-binding protein